MKNIFNLLVALFITSGASGQYFTPLGGPGVQVTRFFTHSGGGVTLYISGEVKNLDDCPVTTRVHLKGDLPGHQNMISAALMAFASGKRIGLHASGCEYIPFWGGSGGGQVPVINNLWVFE